MISFVVKIAMAFPLVMGLLASAASAEVLYYEPFDYAPGALAANPNWTAEGTRNSDVVSGSLSYPGIVSSGNKVDAIGWDYDTTANVDQVWTTAGTYYMTALVQHEDWVASNRYNVGLETLVFADGPGVRVFPIRNEDNSPSLDIVPGDGGNASDVGTALSANTTHLMAVRIIQGGILAGNPGAADNVRVLFDPDLSNPDWANPDLSWTTSSMTDTTVDAVIRLGVYTPDILAYVDEIRVATTWAEATGGILVPPPPTALTLTGVQKVWADDTHNAWPDITYWNNNYYLTFAQGGSSHGSAHSIAVLSSPDGVNWQTVATGLAQGNDATFITTPDQLHIASFNFFARASDPGAQEAALRSEWLSLGGTDSTFDLWKIRHNALLKSKVISSGNGSSWSAEQQLFDDGWGSFKATEYNGQSYMVTVVSQAVDWTITPELEQLIPEAHLQAAVFPWEPDDDHLDGSYTGHPNRVDMFSSGALMTSLDGVNWTKVSDLPVFDNDEASIAFSDTGQAVIITRRGSTSKNGVAFVADAPYDTWTTFPLTRSLHGTDVIYHEGKFITGGRIIDPDTLQTNGLAYMPTALYVFNPNTGELTDELILPSWGDTGYMGLETSPDGDLLVAYYSTDEAYRTAATKIMGPGPLPAKSAPASIYVATVNVVTLLGDMDGDLAITTADVSLFIQALVDRSGYDANNFAVSADFSGDVDGSGTFDSGDLAAFSALFNAASASAVPEPDSVSLVMALSVLALVARRRMGNG